MHQGESDITDQNARDVLDGFRFVYPNENYIVHKNRINERLSKHLNPLRKRFLCMIIGYREVMKKIYAFNFSPVSLSVMNAVEPAQSTSIISPGFLRIRNVAVYLFADLL